nr:hypothetical protein [uncultured Campylobacter sp.]
MDTCKKSIKARGGIEWGSGAAANQARKLRIESRLKSKARRADLQIGRLGKDGTRAANLAIWRAERESKSAVSKEARREILRSLKFYKILPQNLRFLKFYKILLAELAREIFKALGGLF